LLSLSNFANVVDLAKAQADKQGAADSSPASKCDDHKLLMRAHKACREGGIAEETFEKFGGGSDKQKLLRQARAVSTKISHPSPLRPPTRVCSACVHRAPLWTVAHRCDTRASRASQAHQLD